MAALKLCYLIYVIPVRFVIHGERAVAALKRVIHKTVIKCRGRIRVGCRQSLWQSEDCYYPLRKSSTEHITSCGNPASSSVLRIPQSYVARAAGR